MTAHQPIAHPDLLDEGRANSIEAAHHLRRMAIENPDRLAMLRRECAEAEASVAYLNEPISAEIRARAAAEWEEL